MALILGIKGRRVLVGGDLPREEGERGQVRHRHRAGGQPQAAQVRPLRGRLDMLWTGKHWIKKCGILKL